MSKFNFKKAKAAVAVEQTYIATGYYPVRIAEIAEVGYQPAFNAGDPAKESIGFTFQLEDGQQVCKIMPLTMNSFSNFMKILNSVDDADDLGELLGQQLDLEIQGNGKYPKIKGFSPSEDGLSESGELPKLEKITFYSVEEPDPVVLKTLNPDLRRAISARIRAKG